MGKLKVKIIVECVSLKHLYMLKITFGILVMMLSFQGYSQTQMELNEMEYNHFKKQDAELNKAYKQLVAIITIQKDKELLVKAQRAWVAFRDAHCAFTESAYEGGSMQPLVYNGCMTEATLQRIKELKALLEERSPK